MTSPSEQMQEKFFQEKCFDHSIIWENSKLLLKCVRLNKNASLPIYGSDCAAGADLCSAEECVVPAKSHLLVKTGLSVAIPPGHYGRVAPRSGLAVKNFIDVGAGVIDEDYRGEVGVLLFNFSGQDFHVKIGDRIAQLILEKFSRAIVEEVDSLDLTARGIGGFGSTGINSLIKNNGTAQNGNK